MKTKELLQPEQAFYKNKIQPSQHNGLSRIETSMYFESHHDWERQVDRDFKDAKLISKEAFKAINSFSDRFN